MKLFKALKLKNKLVGEISNKKSLIQSNNSYEKGEKSYYNVNTLLTELQDSISDLNNLKMAINVANIGIQETIYKLSEAKSFLSFIKTINTKEGVVKRGGFAASTEDEYFVYINELEKNKIVEEYQKLIEELQDKIDVYNHTTDCVVTLKTIK